MIFNVIVGLIVFLVFLGCQGYFCYLHPAIWFIKTVKTYCNPNLSIWGIVLTRYSSRTVITREATRMLEDTAKSIGTKVFKTKIRECSAVKEAQMFQKGIFSYAPKSNAATDYEALIDELIKEDKSK